MKSVKTLFRTAMVAGALLTFGAHATSWQDSLSSAANQLSSQSGSQQSGGMSLFADRFAQRRQPVVDFQQYE